jgi:hypothetical protein
LSYFSPPFRAFFSPFSAPSSPFVVAPSQKPFEGPVAPSFSTTGFPAFSGVVPPLASVKCKKNNKEGKLI